MQTFNIEYATFEDNFPTRINGATIDAKLLALPDDDSDDLVYHLAGLFEKEMEPTCIMAGMLDDAARGGCTVEERPDLGEASAAPGTRNFLIYFSPSCSYHADYVAGELCGEGLCDCEGDIGVITLTPAE